MAQRFCKFDRKTLRRIRKARQKRREREAQADQDRTWLRRRRVLAAA